VQAILAKLEPGQTLCKIQMVKRDGTEVLRGTASVGQDASMTALDQRLTELKPLGDPVILRDVKVGMKTNRQFIRMDFDRNMGDLYPFSLEDKLKVITEPSPFYLDDAASGNPWGTPDRPHRDAQRIVSIPLERGSLTDQGPCGRPVCRSGDPAAARAIVRRRGLSNGTGSGRPERQPQNRKPLASDDSFCKG